MTLCCSVTKTETQTLNFPVCVCDAVVVKNPELIFTPGKIIQHLCAPNLFFTHAKNSLHTCKSLLHICKLKFVRRVSFYKFTHAHCFVTHILKMGYTTAACETICEPP